MSSAFHTAIVPAAGLGTRFLPTTKAVPKELLPLVDTPAIEYVAREAAEAGASKLVIVTSPEKASVANYFDANPELEQTLAARGKADLVEKIQRAPQLIKAETAIPAVPAWLMTLSMLQPSITARSITSSASETRSASSAASSRIPLSIV